MPATIIWINGAFGSGKTTVAFELHRRLEGSFVYDPENIGFFLKQNMPPYTSTGDFQDNPLWRETNYRILTQIVHQFEGAVIVPMTLVNPQYYDEIVTRLMDDGIEVKHYILSATKETITKRLRLRLATFLRKDTFALSSIDRCIYAFDHYITEEKIETDNRSIDDIVEEIAAKSGRTLPVDTRSGIKKFLNRCAVLIKHIR